MKEWAIENGATHYTHWFQPMTNVTAEKLAPVFDTTNVAVDHSQLTIWLETYAKTIHIELFTG